MLKVRNVQQVIRYVLTSEMRFADLNSGSRFTGAGANYTVCHAMFTFML